MLILFLLFSVSIQAQDKPIAQPESSSSDDMREFFWGYSVSGVTYLATYEALWQFTDIKPKKARWIAFGASLVANTTVSLLRKKYTEGQGYEYSDRNLAFNGVGGITASVKFPILWGKEKRNRVNSIKNRKLMNHKYYNW